MTGHWYSVAWVWAGQNTPCKTTFGPAVDEAHVWDYWHAQFPEREVIAVNAIAPRDEEDAA